MSINVSVLCCSCQLMTTTAREFHSLVFIPSTPTVAIWVQLIKHPVPDRVKPPSFVIFDIRAL